MSNRSTCLLTIMFSIMIIHATKAFRDNVGLMSGNIKKPSNPVMVKKVSHLAPVFVTINSKVPQLPNNTPPPPRVPKMPTKPPPLDIKSLLSKPKPLLTSTRKPRLAPLLPPIIPPLPLLPLPILPLLPPPILPLPLFPLLPKLVDPLKFLKGPLLKKKSPIQKALDSIGKQKSSKLPDVIGKKNILEKLLDLKKKGSLTTAEFIRFKKLLL